MSNPTSRPSLPLPGAASGSGKTGIAGAAEPTAEPIPASAARLLPPPPHGHPDSAEALADPETPILNALLEKNGTPFAASRGQRFLDSYTPPVFDLPELNAVRASAAVAREIEHGHRVAERVAPRRVAHALPEDGPRKPSPFPRSSGDLSRPVTRTDDMAARAAAWSTSPDDQPTTPVDLTEMITDTEESAHVQ